jgi:hypothetical protein
VAVAVVAVLMLEVLALAATEFFIFSTRMEQL